MKKLLFLLTLLMLAMVCEPALAQQNKPKDQKEKEKEKGKSVKQLTKSFIDYIGKNNSQTSNLAQKRSSRPATVTRDSISAEDENSFEDEFESFRKRSFREFENFRDEANAEYAKFMEQAWKVFDSSPAKPQPEEKDVPPVEVKDDDQKPANDNSIAVKEMVAPPVPEPQPVPIAPVPAQDSTAQVKTFTCFGTQMGVHFSDDLSFWLPALNEKNVAKVWTTLASKEYNNLIRDCLQLRVDYQLSDWAYLNMLFQMAKACMGDSNEATLLAAFVYCQSGYKMRLAFANNHLRLLYASKHFIYGQSYFYIDNDYYYPFNGGGEEQMQVCEASFPQEKPLSLWITTSQKFAMSPTKDLQFQSRRYEDVQAKVSVNKNLIDFYETYPTSSLGENFMTRWSMYANTPLDASLKEQLYPVLREELKGYSELEAVERLLNWVQTGFVYEYDEQVWGHDRAFFAEETLYYPSCDCEDRSILLSRLVRDLLGLKTVLVYYPGHLALAVRFNEDVKGDFLTLNGNRFVVCDPTYINARVGRTMPGLDNSEATVIMLE
jgi:hypothetical protein